MNKKVIIIGGGIAGLSAACLALQRGYRVEIYEKQNKLGGNSNYESIEGFNFDVLPKLYPAPYLLDSLLQSNEKSSMLSSLFTQSIPTLHILFADNKIMRFVSEEEIRNIPESVSAITPLTGDAAYHKLETVLQDILNRFSGKRPPLLNQLLNRKDPLDQNLVQKISEFSSDPYFQQTLIALAATSGMPVQELQIRDLFMPALVRRSGLSIPTHGMKAIIQILQEYIKSKGAKVFTDTAVEEIISEHNNVCGVRLEDQSQIWTDFVLNTTAHLAPDEQKNKKIQPSMAIHLGLSQPDLLKQLHPINIIILNNNFRNWDTQKTLDYRWLPDYILLQQPTLINQDLSPENTTQISIRFSIPKDVIDYRENEIIRNNVLTFLEKKYIPDLKQNIRMESIHMLHDQKQIENQRFTPTFHSNASTPSFLVRQNKRIIHMQQYYENRQATLPIIIFAVQQWVETIAKL
jgi:phytoene desaturase